MTIVEAAREAIRRHDAPMTVDEVYDLIFRDGLYKFSSENPKSILTTQIRRNCAGLTLRNSSKLPVFIIHTGKRYSIVPD